MKRIIKESTENDKLAKRFGFEEGELWGKDCYYLTIGFSDFVGWLTGGDDYEISLALSCRTGKEENGYSVDKEVADYIDEAIVGGLVDIPDTLSDISDKKIAKAVAEIWSYTIQQNVNAEIESVISGWFDYTVAGDEHKGWECLDDHSTTEIALYIPEADLTAFLTKVLGGDFEASTNNASTLKDALLDSFKSGYADREFVSNILGWQLNNVLEYLRDGGHLEWSEIKRTVKHINESKTNYRRNIKMTENRNIKRGCGRITEAKDSRMLLYTSCVFDYTDQEIEDWYAEEHEDDEPVGWINTSEDEMEHEMSEYLCNDAWYNFCDDLRYALDGKKLVCVGSKQDQLSQKNGDGGDVVEGMRGVFDLLGDYDDVRFYSDGGLLYAESSDHDGRTGFYIKALTPKGREIYDCWAYGHDDDEEISEMVSNLSEREIHRLLFDNDEYSKTVLASDGCLESLCKPSYHRPSRRISESRNIAHRRALRESNNSYYTEKTAKGYDIEQLYILWSGKTEGRVYAIITKPYSGNETECVIGMGYDIESGDWQQGKYGFRDFADARRWLCDEYSRDYRIEPVTGEELIDLLNSGKLSRRGFVSTETYNEHYRRHYTRKPVVESRRPISRPQSRYARARHN